MSLQDLMQRAEVWRGGAASPVSGLPTGFSELDALLGGNGWPQAALTEILFPGTGSAGLRLLLPALARLSRGDRWIVFVAPPYIPYAPALARAGVNLSRVLWVHAQRGIDGLWAAEQSLCAGTCAAVLAWPTVADTASLRRLQLAAEAAMPWAYCFARNAPPWKARPRRCGSGSNRMPWACARKSSSAAAVGRPARFCSPCAMLWLCIQLPNLALEICTRASPTARPLVVSGGRGRAQQVLACNSGARQRGVQAGMRVSAAYALIDGLCVRERDASAEQAALDRLAAWAGQYTSVVSQTPPQALLLEIAGSLALFGGMDRLLPQVRRSLKALGYTAVFAVAPTPLSATWLARAGRETPITDHASLAGALFSLPLSCLDLTVEQGAMLRGMGLQDLGACLRLPRDGLARRLGPAFVSAIDRAFGRMPDPRPAFTPPPKFDSRLLLPAPLDDAGGLLFPIHRLILELCGFLAGRGSGVRALELIFRHQKHLATRIALELVAPARDPQHLTALLRERLERVTLSEPVEEIVLSAAALEPVVESSLDFFSRGPAPEAARAAIVECLQARLGNEAVRGVCTVAEHRPERAWRYVAPGEAGTTVATKERPLWLLPAPLALAMRDGRPYLDGRLTLEGSRERIESGWWDGVDVRRDYFIARTGRGARFWIYRELDGARRWYLHGVFG